MFILANHCGSTIILANHCGSTNRVKSLSKGGNTKKEQFPVPPASSSKESTYPSYPLSEPEETMERTQETRPLDASRKGVENFNSNSSMEPERNSSMIPSYQHRGKEETSSRSGLNDRERGDLRSSQIGLTSKAQSLQDSVNSHEEVKVTKVSPPRRKANRDEKSERQSNYTKKEEISRTGLRQQQQQLKQQQQQRLSSTSASHVSSKQSEKESSYEDMAINAILEVRSTFFFSD